MTHKSKLFWLIIMCFVACNVTSAQVRKKVTKASSPAPFKPRTSLADSLICTYHFDEAIDVLETDVSHVKKQGESTSTLHKELNRAVIGKNMLEAVEKVVIVDSFVVNKENILKTLNFDANCGQFLTAQEIKQKANLKQQPVGIGYLNNFGDNVIFCQSGKGGYVTLVKCDKFGDAWSTPKPLKGLVDSSAVRGFPYQLSDGATLYFASKDSSSLGGYDIYLTRYNSDTQTYLKPQNVGMPFNSPFNDYLMVYDDVNQLGWFVSDRFQPEGKVCVYVFIPNQTRNVYEDIDANDLNRLASLNSISLTQKGNEALVQSAKKRLQDVTSNTTKSQRKDTPEQEFAFDLSYGVRYTNINQFKNKEARNFALSLLDLKRKKEELIALLNDNRQKYAKANSAIERKAIAPIILRQETELNNLYLQIYKTENSIRNLEMTK